MLSAVDDAVDEFVVSGSGELEDSQPTLRAVLNLGSATVVLEPVP